MRILFIHLIGSFGNRSIELLMLLLYQVSYIFCRQCSPGCEVTAMTYITKWICRHFSTHLIGSQMGLICHLQPFLLLPNHFIAGCAMELLCKMWWWNKKPRYSYLDLNPCQQIVTLGLHEHRRLVILQGYISVWSCGTEWCGFCRRTRSDEWDCSKRRRYNIPSLHKSHRRIIFIRFVSYRIVNTLRHPWVEK